MISKLNYLKSIGCEIKKSEIVPGEFSDVIYTKDGLYVGHSDIDNCIVDIIYKHRLVDLGTVKTGTVVCIGFSPEKQEWFGWSHRGVTHYKIGDEIKPNDVCCSDGEIKAGFKCKTLEDCKKCALAAAESLS